MEKLVDELKKRFLDLVEGIKACKFCNFGNKGNEDGYEPKLKSVQKLGVQDRAIHVAATRGPKRPGVPKGPPPQTS